MALKSQRGRTTGLPNPSLQPQTFSDQRVAAKGGEHPRRAPGTRPSAIVAALAGLLTGGAAGLIGVGGGELRLPVLIQWLQLSVRQAGSVNLVVGLCTVVVSFARRWDQVTWTRADLVLVLVMAVASLIGSPVGALLRETLPVRPLKRLMSGYLAVVGLWMLSEAALHAEHVLLDPVGWARMSLAGAVGFAIALVSGVFGVAGGEMRIPALLYLFDLPIKAAGTLSLAVSIPTVFAGAMTDRQMGGLPNELFGLTAWLGATSVLGAVIGATFLARADAAVLRGVLGVLLCAAAIRLWISEVTAVA